MTYGLYYSEHYPEDPYDYPDHSDAWPDEPDDGDKLVAINDRYFGPRYVPTHNLTPCECGGCEDDIPF